MTFNILDKLTQFLLSTHKNNGFIIKFGKLQIVLNGIPPNTISY